MGCCGQTLTGAGAVDIDAGKRVNYTFGMLLGVDDFVQEAAYRDARRRELARELLGYGTVRGLRVLTEPDGDAGPRLRVGAGMAWTPSGTAVCVEADQCANLNGWLAANAAAVGTALGGSPGPRPLLALHVVLSPASCLTDNVPIPGEPCRSEDELMQPSRVTDSFRLELRLAAPPQREEDAVIDFVDWLLGLPVDTGSPPLTEADFIARLREAAQAWLHPSSPPGVPGDFMLGTAPPAAYGDEGLQRIALRLWATELRPLWMACYGCGCGGEATRTAPGSADDAVLLGTLQVPLVAASGGTGSGGWLVDDSSSTRSVTIDESRRPVLLSLRMVQELIAQRPVPAAGDAVTAETSFGLPFDTGVSAQYARADHTHGTPELPALAGDVSGPFGDTRVEGLLGMPIVADSPPVDRGALLLADGVWQVRDVALPGADLANEGDGPTLVTGLQGFPVAVPGGAGEALVFDGAQWVTASIGGGGVLPPLGGDVTGTLGAMRVAQLQGLPLDAPAPATDDVLRFDGGKWVPAALPPATALPPLGGDLSGAIGAARLEQLQGQRVSAGSPAADDVLRFDGTQWVAAAIPASAGEFVGRGAGPYVIAAAGEVEVSFADGGGLVAVLSSYGQLVADGTRNFDDSGRRQLVELSASPRPSPGLDRFVVKLTPMWSDGSETEFRLYVLNEVQAEGRAIRLQVLLSADADLGRQRTPFRFQIEISRFGQEG